MSRTVLAALSLVFATEARVPPPSLHAPRAVVGVEEAILLAGDGAAGDQFGCSVALSADGSRALIGVWQDDTLLANNVGSARVFVRTAGSWALEATFHAADGSEMTGFGTAVALSADGSRALVGAPQDDTTAEDAGSVHVFSRTGGTWTEEAALLAPDGSTLDYFGSVVSLAADGSRALVGAPEDNSPSGSAAAGSAHMFRRAGTAWNYETKLASGTSALDRLGHGLAFSGDGMRAIVGAPGEGSVGGAHVFSIASGAWTEETTLRALDGANDDMFGGDVALSADGSRALVGAVYDDTSAGVDAGSVRVFARTGTTWTEQATLLASDGSAGDGLGVGLALSADGTHALVGALGDDLSGAADAGSVHVFTWSDAAWADDEVLLAPDGAAGDGFGVAVALSADGGRALIGVPGDSNLGEDAGSAHVFTQASAGWSHETALIAPDGASADLGRSVSLSADGMRALVGARGDYTIRGVAAGSARVYLRTGTRWVEEATLRASDGVHEDSLGTSVSLSADGTRALVGAPGYNSGVVPSMSPGSARVFVRTDTTWSEEATLLASDAAAGDQLGASVALSADGNWAIVGAPSDDVDFAQAVGSARVFGRTGSTWTEVTTLLAPDGSVGDWFGTAVAVTEDGSRALVSGRRGTALAVVYARSSAGWTQEAVLPLSLTGTASGMGLSLAVTADGSRALIGVGGESTAAALQAGTVHPFSRTGTSWTAQAPLVAADGAFRDAFGTSVAVSADGARALIGAPGDASLTGEDEAGSARVFVWDGSNWVEDATLRAPDALLWDSFGSSVALDRSGSRALIGVAGDATLAGGNAGSARVFSLRDTDPNGAPCSVGSTCSSGACVGGLCVAAGSGVDGGVIIGGDGGGAIGGDGGGAIGADGGIERDASIAPDASGTASPPGAFGCHASGSDRSPIVPFILVVVACVCFRRGGRGRELRRTVHAGRQVE